MKSSLRLFLAGALLAPAALFAASFEGKVTFKMTAGKGQPQELQQSIKDGKVRMETAGKGGMGAMIIDSTKKEMLMMMDDQKMYMVMALPEGAAEKIAKERDDVKFEKTDETEKILGYKATKYISTSKDGTKTDMWLAEGIGSFTAFSNNSNPMAGGRRGGNAPTPDWERLLAGKDLFPLRVVGYDKAAKESFRMEVVSIEKQSLPDSLFTPPANYQKLDMGGMMKGMIPGFGK